MTDCSDHVRHLVSQAPELTPEQVAALRAAIRLTRKRHAEEPTREAGR